MAQKTLQTRIINKHGALAAWNESSLKLKEGEIALAYVEVATQDGKGNIITVPTYVMKVGHKDAEGNEQAFKDLPFLAAPASDVYPWAKEESLSYANLPEQIRQEVATLKSQMGTSGDSVETLIANAIKELDYADVAVSGEFVTAVVQEDGKISVTRAKVNVADVVGLQAALDEKATVTSVTNLGAALEGEAAQRAAKDEAIENALAQLRTDIGNITNVMNFRGTYESTDAVTEPKVGDVVVVGNKEYVYTDKNEWCEYGDASANATAISELQQRMTAAEQAIDTKVSTATFETTVNNINTEVGLKANTTYVDEEVGKVNTSLLAHIEAYTTKIGTIENNISDHTTDIANLRTDVNAANAKATTNASNIAALQTRVLTIESDYLREADTFIIDCGEIN